MNTATAEPPKHVLGRASRLLAGLILGAIVLAAGSYLQRAFGQDIQPGQQVDTSLLEWPRYYSTNGYDFAVYQPQINQWPSNYMEARLVVAVRPTGTTNETYGVVFLIARTEIDKVNRLVTLENVQITKVNFPTARSMQPQYTDMMRSFQKHTARVVPLDHLEAVFAASGDIARAKVQQVKNDPPRIIYNTRPSLLILVDGAPIQKPLVGDYQRVVNTRPVLLHNTNPQVQSYFLYAANQWYTAPSLEGPWQVATAPPADIGTALNAAVATKQVDLMPLRDTNAAPPAFSIYVSMVPAELIETEGVVNLQSIDGTDLLYVANSSNAIFYYMDDSNFYVLLSGRWFKGGSLYGPWAFVPAGQLPADFQKIPADSDKSNALASVPGTTQSQEAVIANSIPQTATIIRSNATLTVDYSGAPSFVGIPGTTLTYAANSATPVIMVAPKSFYACQSGVWFTGPSATGPWAVATTVPASIYSIPPSCPIHYVTYAYVYGSTPTTVYVGYTPGYMGTVVAPGGVVVYGTGYSYPPMVVGDSYISYPPTYGYGAAFAMGAASGFAFGFAAGCNSGCWCQPYWGCYAVATPYSYAHVNVCATSCYTSWGTAVHATGSYGYNPYTGTSWANRSATTYNPYTGTRGSVSGSAAYNPYTGNAAAARSGSWYNPYSGASAQASSSASANRSTGDYSGTRQASGYTPTTGRYASGETSVSGNVRDGTASVSSSGTAGNTKTGNSISWNNGNMYADKNGNMYTYNPSSGAQKYNTGTGAYEPVSRSATPSPAAPAANTSNWAERAGASQFTGAQRFNSFAGAGGGGFGGGRFRR